MLGKMPSTQKNEMYNIHKKIVYIVAIHFFVLKTNIYIHT
jgi:hypothetical protein